MTQRWRRKAGSETYTMGDCRNFAGKVDLYRDTGISEACISREQFEREYEPVPSEGDVSRACMICEQTAKSLQLADKLAGAVLQQRDMIPYAHWDEALSEYLESRGKGR